MLELAIECTLDICMLNVISSIGHEESTGGGFSGHTMVGRRLNAQDNDSINCDNT